MRAWWDHLDASKNGADDPRLGVDWEMRAFRKIEQKKYRAITKDLLGLILIHEKTLDIIINNKVKVNWILRFSRGASDDDEVFILFERSIARYSIYRYRRTTFQRFGWRTLKRIFDCEILGKSILLCWSFFGFLISCMSGKPPLRTPSAVRHPNQASIICFKYFLFHILSWPSFFFVSFKASDFKFRVAS